MTRDLKHRTPPAKTPQRRFPRWLIGGVLFIGLGLALRGLVEGAHPTRPPASPAEQLPTPKEASFGFFRILEDREQRVAEQEIQAEARHLRTGKPSRAGAFSLLLGTFRHRAELESMRRQLAAYETLTPKAEEIRLTFSTWYRLSLGPYGHLADAIKVRRFLKAQGLDSVVTTPLPP